MFEACSTPRVFGMPPGADFGEALVDGLISLTSDSSPEQLARAEVYVNTSRMQRRLREVFDSKPALLLPRIKLITDLASDPLESAGAPPMSSLRRRLELARYVTALIEREPDLAPEAAAFDLADSLAGLMDEMHGEGVMPSALEELDVTDLSGHWQRSLRFLNIMRPFFGEESTAPHTEARQRDVIVRLRERWRENPPDHPIIVAGSTGSRGATALFMDAVARLPQGAVVLPGFDFEMPKMVWSELEKDAPLDDHPQYRLHRFIDHLGLTADDVQQWLTSMAPDPARNAVISVSLRPAPVTDQWLRDGPALGDLQAATEGITLFEAETPRAEAETIALRLRVAAQEGQTAALITPDRMLTRQVAAALDRWRIVPDDSAGIPLAQSAPGRLLLHVAGALGAPLTTATLLILLKHPLTHSDSPERGLHLRRTRELELFFRGKGVLHPDEHLLDQWVKKTAEGDPDRPQWAAWVASLLGRFRRSAQRHLSVHFEGHIGIAEMLSAGTIGKGSGALWLEAAGREAQRICQNLREHADAGDVMSASAYRALFGSILSEGVVRDRDAGHPGILIWGTLEARVQGADLVILGGMNEGVWPEAPKPDPWLNRQMRMSTGLPLPERKIGLSAHDYQQAIGAREVWITRAIRTADAETVPSRWLNRLVNLVGGLEAQNGPAALEDMRNRARSWARQAEAISTEAVQVDSAKRPSPRPPVAARPKELSVTRIKTLIRDPYAIYAEKVLRLRPLESMTPQPDAPLRGIIYHGILEEFIKSRPDASDAFARDRFIEIAQRRLEVECPWPTVRLMWLTRLERIAAEFLRLEERRQARGEVALIEGWGEIIVPGPDVRLTCKADRMDLTPDGKLLIYDYKTGAMPTEAQQLNFDKQLLLEAAMAERGAFVDIGALPVEAAAFIGVGSNLSQVEAPLMKHPPDENWQSLILFLTAWNQETQGYTARAALFKQTDRSLYDHLSRFGEWSTSDNVDAVVLS